MCGLPAEAAARQDWQLVLVTVAKIEDMSPGHPEVKRLRVLAARAIETERERQARERADLHARAAALALGATPTAAPHEETSSFQSLPSDETAPAAPPISRPDAAADKKDRASTFLRRFQKGSQ